MNFKEWKKGINIRFLIDSFLTLILISFIHYMTITYMKANMKIDPDTNYLISPLLYFIGTERIEQLNKIETSGFFVGLTYCFFCSCYLLFAVICRGVFSCLYLFHTGYGYHQRIISSTDALAFVTVTVYCVFYIYACIRVPEYYEAIEQWGELIEDPLILTFNANLHNFNKN